MLRILFVLLVVLLVFWIWQRLRSPASANSQAHRRTIQNMVSCARCGLHIAPQEAVRSGHAWYCCQAHLPNNPPHP